MTVESGPASGDRNYFLIVSVLCLGMFVYFIYDWQIGYPAANRKEAREQLGLLLNVPADEVEIVEPHRPTKPDYERVSEGQPLSVEQLREVFGQPTLRQAETGGQTIEYYASEYGMATVTVRSGRVLPKNITWATWYKTKDEVESQFWFGLIPLLIGLYTGYRLYRAVTLRVVVDDEGLLYGGQRIPYGAIKDIRDYSPKGWVDLYYDDGGRERKLRLDNQKFKRFEAVVDALCVQKGLTNPLPKDDGEAADAGDPPPEVSSEEKPPTSSA